MPESDSGPVFSGQPVLPDLASAGTGSTRADAPAETRAPTEWLTPAAGRRLALSGAILLFVSVAALVALALGRRRW